MSGILCWFNQCKWRFIANTGKVWNRPSDTLVGALGLYQCSRCKTLSIGKPGDV